MKNKLTPLVMFAAALVCGSSLFAQPATPAATAPATPAAPRPAGRASPHETVSQTFDGQRDTRVVVIYGRPYAKGRTIWGGELVPAGKVWRMGADEATTLLTQQPIQLGGTMLPAGAYSLDMQVEADGSANLIVGKRLGQWGIPYVGNSEVARIAMTKGTVEAAAEQFTIALERNPAGGGVLKATWNTTQYSLPFTIKKG